MFLIVAFQIFLGYLLIVSRWLFCFFLLSKTWLFVFWVESFPKLYGKFDNCALTIYPIIYQLNWCVNTIDHLFLLCCGEFSKRKFKNVSTFASGKYKIYASIDSHTYKRFIFYEYVSHFEVFSFFISCDNFSNVLFYLFPSNFLKLFNAVSFHISTLTL